jgi:hypothetical protein
MSDTNPTSSPKRRASAPTARVSSLDLERQASMADEGGVSAALLEIDDPKERRRRHPGLRSRSYLPNQWIVAGALTLFAVAGATWWLRRA